MMYSFRSQHGLTLIESLVAVFIFSLSLVALMVISSRGIQSIAVASTRATAQFLAQEGIEIIEAIRDDNFLNVNSSSWLANLDPCMTGNGCYISAFEFAPTPSSSAVVNPVECSSSCPPLLRTTGANESEYYYGSGDLTSFVRTIQIKGDPSNDVARIISNVRWSRSGVDYDVEVVKYMMNWFQPTLTP